MKRKKLRSWRLFVAALFFYIYTQLTDGLNTNVHSHKCEKPIVKISLC